MPPGIAGIPGIWGIPPSPPHLAEVIQKMAANNIKVVLVEPYQPHKTAWGGLQRLMKDQPVYHDKVRAAVQERGPLTSADLHEGDGPRRTDYGHMRMFVHKRAPSITVNAHVSTRRRSGGRPCPP